MRRSIALIAALALLAAIPTAVAAKKPSQFSDHYVAIFCDGIAPTSGSGFLFLGVSISDEFGPDAFVEMWNAASPTGPPDIFRDFDSPVDASYAGGTLTASIPLVDSTGDPAGTGSVAATLTPVGDPFTFEDSFKEGNTQVRFTQVTQPLAATGSALIGGKTFDLDGCFAEDTTIAEWRTSPNSFIIRFDTALTDCTVTNGDGSTVSVFFDASSTTETFVDAFIESGPGSPLGAFGIVTLTGGSGSASLELYDPETGEPVAGAGSIDLSLTEGHGYRYVLTAANGHSIVRGSLIDVEGTLTLPGTAPFDLTSCVSFVGTDKQTFHNQQGPQPKGKVPSNDLPSGAKLLNVGSKTSQSTRAAAPDREAPYACLTFEDPPGEFFEIPVQKTVWFKVLGTGSEVTVDTAGSDFDTVAAAYVSGGPGGFTEVACVDDVPLDPFGRTLQAAITFPTEIGTTYFVQIGGFPDFGGYGNLRVAVR